MTSLVSFRQVRARKGIGVAARIRQATKLLIPHLSFDCAGILRVVQGRKHVTYGERSIVFEQGSVALFGGGHSLDVVNEPDANGIYRAEAIFFDSEFLQSPRTKGNVEGAMAISEPTLDLSTALSHAIEAIEDERLPDTVAANRVREVLIWLSDGGHNLSAPRPRDLPARVRQLIATNPGHDWQAAEISRDLATSEATLRRRLSAAGTTLSAILLDLRMSSALGLLQATDIPISNIAHSVGYESASRFAQRFKERFGFQPSEIRQRIGE